MGWAIPNWARVVRAALVSEDAARIVLLALLALFVYLTVLSGGILLLWTAALVAVWWLAHQTNELIQGLGRSLLAVMVGTGIQVLFIIVVNFLAATGLEDIESLAEVVSTYERAVYRFRDAIVPWLAPESGKLIGAAAIIAYVALYLHRPRIVRWAIRAHDAAGYFLLGLTAIVSFAVATGQAWDSWVPNINERLEQTQKRSLANKATLAVAQALYGRLRTNPEDRERFARSIEDIAARITRSRESLRVWKSSPGNDYEAVIVKSTAQQIVEAAVETMPADIFANIMNRSGASTAAATYDEVRHAEEQARNDRVEMRSVIAMTVALLAGDFVGTAVGNVTANLAELASQFLSDMASDAGGWAADALLKTAPAARALDAIASATQATSLIIDGMSGAIIQLSSRATQEPVSSWLSKAISEAEFRERERALAGDRDRDRERWLPASLCGYGKVPPATTMRP
jgi:hypothetical protein